MTDTFDYIIVGAGSAGSALADRLTEDASVSVLLLEAGPEAKSPNIAIPAAFAKQFKSELDWNYETTPQRGLDGRTVFWPRGKVLGGSSAMNAMMWVSGFAADYEKWGELAGPDWGWSAMKPLIDGAKISVSPQRDPRAHTARFLEAVQEAGYSVEDANTDEPQGFSQTLVTQKNGMRNSAAKAYLVPIRKQRKNLVIRTGAHVTRVCFDGTTATGVEYVIDGATVVVNAVREVILAGGAINTPQLLMLSGIGDPEQLKPHGIDVVAASPEVGANMRDHLVSLLAVGVDGGTLMDAEGVGQLARFLVRRKGMLTSNVAEAYGFVRSDPSLALPDLEIIFAPVAYVDEGLTGIPEHGLTMGPILLQPASRGEIRLASADPFAKPIVDPRYLSDADGVDRATVLAGLAICRTIFASPSLRAITNGRIIRPFGGASMSDEDLLVTAMEQLSHTLYHPTSTARMGIDEQSVVDPALRVRGVQNLRVADASVMPEIIRGHTHAPSVAIGEQAAKLLRAG